MHVGGRDPGVDLGDVGDLVRGRGVHHRRLVARRGRVELAHLALGGQEAALEGVALLGQGAEAPGAWSVQGDLRDIGDLGRVGIVGGGLRPEGGLGGQVDDPRREGADRGPAQPGAGCGVDRHLRVVDLLATEGEHPEGKAVLALPEDARRRGDYRTLAGRGREDLLKCLPLRGGELRRYGGRKVPSPVAVVG